MGRNESGMLEAKLLAEGGERVVRMDYTPPEAQLERGRVFDVKGRKRVRGLPHQGHANAAMHYLMSRHFGRGRPCQLVTGYALFGGLWCGHSWCWHAAGVLETCGSPSLYYGYALDDAEASSFVVREVARVLPWQAPFLRERFENFPKRLPR